MVNVGKYTSLMGPMGTPPFLGSASIRGVGYSRRSEAVSRITLNQRTSAQVPDVVVMVSNIPTVII